MTPEGKVKAQVRQVLQKNGAWWYFPVQNGFGVVGVPDIIACMPMEVTQDMVGKTIGVFVAVETKAPGKIRNTTPNQRRNLTSIHKACGTAMVADGPDVVASGLEVLKKNGESFFYLPEG